MMEKTKVTQTTPNQIYTSDQLNSYQKSGKIGQLNFKKSNENNRDHFNVVNHLSSVSDQTNGVLPVQIKKGFF